MPAEQGFLAVRNRCGAEHRPPGRGDGAPGKIRRVYEPDCLEEVLTELVRDYRQNDAVRGTEADHGRKEYPREAGETLRRAGFMQEMGDFVLYR